MVMRWSKKKRPKKEEKQLKEREKIDERIFTKELAITLNDFMRRKIISSIDFPISTGKEADVYRATSGSKEYGDYVALKIYRIETTGFINMMDYITGDPRFGKIKPSRKAIVLTWARKEFKNLLICKEANVYAPKPYAVIKNVLAMEFIGEDGIPASTLKQIGSQNPKEEFEEIINNIKKLYEHSLIHADLSEYNILLYEGKPYFIDFAQAVIKKHPKAEEFLQRDISNILRFYSKYGIEKSLKEVLDFIKSGEDEKS
ncbi:MAG: serine protein kinase RIO [Candidatus Micrarchaeia archaeon]|jgi:RIO kinase 1